MTALALQSWIVAPEVERVAREFSPEEWETYKKDHPGAKRERHTIRERKRERGKEEEKAEKPKGKANETKEALKAAKPKIESKFKEAIGEQSQKIADGVDKLLSISEGSTSKFLKHLPTAGIAVGAAVGAALGPEWLDALGSGDLATMLPGIKGTLLAGAAGAAMGAIPGSATVLAGLGALGVLAKKLAKWAGGKEGKTAADLADMPDDLKQALLDYFTNVTDDEMALVGKAKSKENAASLAAAVLKQEEEKTEGGEKQAALMNRWSSMENTKQACVNLRALMALLQAMYQHYYTAHWTTRGEPFYGKHLMFQRIYEAIDEEVDSLAEKLVAFFGAEAVEPVALASLMQGWLQRWSSIEDLRRRSLQAEKDFQESLRLIYDQLEKEGSLTLGLDDFLAAIANTHETHTYLVQQSLGGVSRVATLIEAWGRGYGPGRGYECGYGPGPGRGPGPGWGGYGPGPGYGPGWAGLPGEMTPLEKSWGGYSSFRPIRRGEEDEDEEVDADDLDLDASWESLADDEGYFHSVPQWSELRERAESGEREKMPKTDQEPFEGWTLSATG